MFLIKAPISAPYFSPTRAGEPRGLLLPAPTPSPSVVACQEHEGQHEEADGEHVDRRARPSLRQGQARQQQEQPGEPTHHPHRTLSQVHEPPSPRLAPVTRFASSTPARLANRRTPISWQCRLTTSNTSRASSASSRASRSRRGSARYSFASVGEVGLRLPPLRDEGKFQFRLNVPRKADRKSYWPIPVCTRATTSCSGSRPPGGSPSGDRAPRPWRPEYRWRRAGRHRERSLPRPAPGPPGTQRRAAPPRSGL